jgi:hypothetical protein
MNKRQQKKVEKKQKQHLKAILNSIARFLKDGQ